VTYFAKTASNVDCFVGPDCRVLDRSLLVLSVGGALWLFHQPFLLQRPRELDVLEVETIGEGGPWSSSVGLRITVKMIVSEWYLWFV